LKLALTLQASLEYQAAKYSTLHLEMRFYCLKSMWTKLGLCGTFCSTQEARNIMRLKS